ncbi:hypothetical protein IWX90DRAFT_474354 [Phyllosticta citrichinensis]|uniref:Uncharacterized protein n=1 Tax=Phyllosticta citrichinensis TaxID=1130410 RepID=A0ABR1Y6P1_9PEZI
MNTSVATRCAPSCDCPWPNLRKRLRGCLSRTPRLWSVCPSFTFRSGYQGDPDAGDRAMETALTGFKDPRLELHCPVPAQPKEYLKMRHLARYEQPGDDSGTSSSTMSTTTTTPGKHRRAPDHGGPLPPVISPVTSAGVLTSDPEPQMEHEMETSSTQQLRTPDSDLYDGLYGATSQDVKSSSSLPLIPTYSMASTASASVPCALTARPTRAKVTTTTTSRSSPSSYFPSSFAMPSFSVQNGRFFVTEEADADPTPTRFLLLFYGFRDAYLAQEAETTAVRVSSSTRSNSRAPTSTSSRSTAARSPMASAKARSTGLPRRTRSCTEGPPPQERARSGGEAEDGDDGLTERNATPTSQDRGGAADAEGI